MNSSAPQSTPDEGSPQQSGLFNRFLRFVEWLGNLLPHPVSLFALFCVGVVVISGITGWLEVSVADPRPEGAKGRDASGVINAVSLMNGAGLRRMLMELVNNFVGFAPLGTVLVALLGVGVAESSGLLSAAIRAVVLKAPKNLVTFAVVFAAVLSNTASEMGYVVLIPMAAVVFHSLGRHPLAGLAAAFAGVSGGYSANLLIGTVDPLLAGITEEAARLIDPAYSVNPTANWFFMMISTVLITVVGTWVTVKIVEPNLGEYDPSRAADDVGDQASLEELTSREKRGLWLAGLSILVIGVLVALCVVPEGAPLRDPAAAIDAHITVKVKPFLKSIVAIIFVFFLVPGAVYGRVVGTMKNDRDVIDGMAKAMGSMGLYIVLVFFAAQFVAYFKWTNLGAILAVTGAEWLQQANLDGAIVFFPFIIMCCFVNLMLGSASAQWAVTAPIFVPMLMLIGYSPELIQAAYRIGDSTTNVITPMMSYFGLILAFAVRYDRKLGIGTLISTMLPYSMFFFIGWVALFYLWVFVFGLPVGPGTTIEYIPSGG